MIRKIIKIDEKKCNGCGVCVSACHEGAIGLVDGKAKLMRDDYCDGLGDCLPSCPTGAISFEQREAADYNEKAVMENRLKKHGIANHGGCPGSKLSRIMHGYGSHTDIKAESRLSQWPVQIKLVPVNAPYFDGADLLIAADCTAFAYGNFHNDFIKDKITLIGCPKLDSVDYSEKLTAILAVNDIKSVTVVRMEVPCCGGIQTAVQKALDASGKNVTLNVTVISTDGKIKNK
ncbi:MAG: 4Fe-4S binding protein [Oscillospiraceae bacterium]|nr:4Fe-4S binding protein [Oscillospiraceae bacterium]